MRRHAIARHPLRPYDCLALYGRRDAVCAAVGLTVVDLMPVNTVNVNGTRRMSQKTGVPLTLTRHMAETTFATARDAVAELERRHGTRACSASQGPLKVVTVLARALGCEPVVS